ncbi:hypothetical protein AQUCO_03500211v1 [Aquilegia coerulea]|uniref:Uncharacterized protein n=1 Tax=Aquilegia coerulea TaxID=218851 RepID=A0A2G5CXQ4_AQUCA|nr:hypothetical protein AQUCO_03500211v1 [Aquilegia coerulea]
MGIIGGCFTLVVGTIGGVYLAQNYNLPNIKNLTETGLFLVKQFEQGIKKKDKPQND